MSVFEVHPLSKEDIPRIAGLWRSLLNPPWTKKMIEDSFNLSTTLAYGAFSQSEENVLCLVGFIIGATLQEEAEIYGIAVQESYQGKKIGSALLKKFEQAFFCHKGKTIFLEVAQYNQKAQNFYLSQGYNLITKRASYYSQKEGAWIFRKEVSCRLK